MLHVDCMLIPATIFLALWPHFYELAHSEATAFAVSATSVHCIM